MVTPPLAAQPAVVRSRLPHPHAERLGVGAVAGTEQERTDALPTKNAEARPVDDVAEAPPARASDECSDNIRLFKALRPQKAGIEAILLNLHDLDLLDVRMRRVDQNIVFMLHDSRRNAQQRRCVIERPL